MPVELMIKCSSCGEIKGCLGFHKNRTKHNGYNSYCKGCISKYKKEYKTRKSDDIREKDAAYRLANKDKINERRNRWREKNKDKVNEQSRNQYAIKRDEIKSKRDLNSEQINDRVRKIMHGKCRSKNYMKHIPSEYKPIFENGYISVLCKKCGSRFFPKYLSVRNCSLSFRGLKITGENGMYCSDVCKNTCNVFGFKPTAIDPRSIISKRKKSVRSCQTRTLKTIQCEENCGQSHCEKCGDFIDVELHHTLPIAVHGDASISPAGHMLLCAGCHVELHRECR